MKGFPLKALFAALAVHAAILLLGGLLLFRPESKRTVREDIELVADEPKPREDKKDEPEEKRNQAAPIEEPDEPIPEMRELAALESAVNAPALTPLSLADLEGVLSGEGTGGAFGVGGGGLSSGGRIGGTGSPGSLADEVADIASIADLDQRPRVIFQSPPSYPSELRKRTVEGTVQVVFLVDTSGRVVNPKIEKSTNPAFERPALEAVRQWKFEAGTRQGEKVAFKMRVPITFSAS